ncbi:hypothetical protein ATKI12_8939 [Kitasatospora sp. Ki12]
MASLRASLRTLCQAVREILKSSQKFIGEACMIFHQFSPTSC